MSEFSCLKKERKQREKRTSKEFRALIGRGTAYRVVRYGPTEERWSAVKGAVSVKPTVIERDCN